jgi:COMPASS component SWD3
VRLWDYIEGRCVKTYQGHRNRTYSTGGAFGTYRARQGGPDHGFAASGSEDGAVLLWDVSDKTLLQRLEGHRGVVLGVDALMGHDLMVSGGLDRTVRVWAVDEAAQAAFEDAAAAASAAARSPDRPDPTPARDDDGEDGEEGDVKMDDEKEDEDEDEGVAVPSSPAARHEPNGNANGNGNGNGNGNENGNESDMFRIAT